MIIENGKTELTVVHGRNSQPLATRIADALGCSLAVCDIKNFSDGELWVKYRENIRGQDVFIIQSTQPPSDNLMELLILIDAAKRASAKRVTAVIPYFGYARQDRKDQPRVSITAKLVANLLTSAGADRVVGMDLHAHQIQGFFDLPFDHLYASPVYNKVFLALGIPDLSVVSPDVGGIKMARAYAKRLSAELVVIDKRRPSPNVAEVMNIIGHVEGRNILIVDDILDTGGTFSNAVIALKKAGAKRIFGACTHALFSGDAPSRLVDSGLEKMYVTDTVPLRPEAEATGLVEVISVAPIFAEAIKRTHSYQSISSLFDVDKDKSM